MRHSELKSETEFPPGLKIYRFSLNKKKMASFSAWEVATEINQILILLGF